MNPLLNERAMKILEERLAVLNGDRGDPLEWALRRSHLKEVQTLIGAEITRLNLVGANVTALEASMAAVQADIDAAELAILDIYADLAAIDTDVVAEGTTNFYFTFPRVRATPLTGLSLASAAAIAATDNLLAALGQLQAQISLNGTLASLGAATLGRPRSVITDSLAAPVFNAAAVGGGAVVAPVWPDGAIWRYG